MPRSGILSSGRTAVINRENRNEDGDVTLLWEERLESKYNAGNIATTGESEAITGSAGSPMLPPYLKVDHVLLYYDRKDFRHTRNGECQYMVPT
jgi:hypothetical protein